MLRDAHCVFFTCEEERRLARQSFWLYDCHEFVLPYGTAGVEPPELDARSAFLDKHPSLVGKRLIIFLGRVHPKKGPDLLIEAVKVALDKRHLNSTDFRIVMARSFFWGICSILEIADQSAWY